MLHDFSNQVQEPQENLYNFGLRIIEPIHRASKTINNGQGDHS